MNEQFDLALNTAFLIMQLPYSLVSAFPEN